MAAILLLDTSSHTWTYRIPPQQCGHCGVAWSTRLSDRGQLSPSLVLGGSIHMRIARFPDEPLEAVPPVDGVHFVQMVIGRHRGLWTFVRAQGQVIPVSIDAVTVDDDDAMLTASMHLLALA